MPSAFIRVDPRPIVICCSHTHAGPIAYADSQSGRVHYRAINTLVERIARAVQRAAAALVPVELSWGQAETDIAVNRRQKQPDGEVVTGVNPAGPVDRSVGVLRVSTADGSPLVTVVNFACHGTILGPDNLLVSADWIGATRARVEQALGGSALFLQGAAGDLNPDYEWGTGDPWEAVRSLGERVADQVLAACERGLTPLAAAPLRLSRQEVWLPLEAAASTVFASVSDGCIGYLPTAQAHAEGGYEVDWAPYFYRYPARLAAGCAQLATDATTQALHELWQD